MANVCMTNSKCLEVKKGVSAWTIDYTLRVLRDACMKRKLRYTGYTEEVTTYLLLHCDWYLKQYGSETYNKNLLTPKGIILKLKSQKVIFKEKISYPWKLKPLNFLTILHVWIWLSYSGFLLCGLSFHGCILSQ